MVENKSSRFAKYGPNVVVQIRLSNPKKNFEKRLNNFTKLITKDKKTFVICS